MKLKLPNGETIVLDTKLEIDDRQKIVKGILNEWQDYFNKSWNTQKTKVCLEVLSNYLCQYKEEEEKNREDKFVMSNGKMKKQKRGD